jgi:hypothetical protein
MRTREPRRGERPATRSSMARSASKSVSIYTPPKRSITSSRTRSESSAVRARRLHFTAAPGLNKAHGATCIGVGLVHQRFVA